jgi:hypothetical protein
MTHRLLAATLITACLVACKQESSTTSTSNNQAAAPTIEAKPAAPATPAAPAAPKAEAPASSATWHGDNISWVNPPGWTTGPDDKPFRLASAKMDGAPEIALTKFGMMTGELADNINRWRQQVGLPPVYDADQLKKNTSDITIDGRKGLLADYTGPEGRLLVLMITDEQSRRRYFVKMIDKDPSKVGAYKKDFMAIVQSIKFGK